MKRIRAKIAIVTMMASVVPALAGDLGTAAVRDCTWCHGASGQGAATAPRLAGQSAQYIESQLLNFHVHTRDNPFSKQYMWGAASSLNPRVARDLAVYFAALPPRAANDGDHDLAVAGRQIYEQGMPDANIVPCSVCHGPNAEGARAIPRLAGLSYYYLKRRLAQWGEGYHSTAEPPMPRIASRLAPDVIEALASYLSFVP
jgi:cytochrome c553